jgi:hypothetical protein
MNQSWITILGTLAVGALVGSLAHAMARRGADDAAWSDPPALTAALGGVALLAWFGAVNALVLLAYGAGFAGGFRAARRLGSGEPGAGRSAKTREALAYAYDETAAARAFKPPSTPVRPHPAAAASVLPQITAEHDRAIAAVIAASRDLQRRMIQTANQAERQRLVQLSEALSDRLDQLNAVRRHDIFESAAVKTAFAGLQRATAELEDEAKRIKQVANTAQQVAKVLDRSTQVLRALASLGL